MKENIDGPTEEFTRENGKKINFTEKVSTHGQMVECMKEITKMTKNMDSALTLGLTENLMKANGQTESNMVKPDSPIQKEEARWVFGKTEKESNGLTPNPLSFLRAQSMDPKWKSENYSHK